MSHDHTLPGHVPGLLRRGSPCLWTTEDGLDGDAGDPVLYPGDWPLSGLLALDLTDPTGRIHALWWWLGLPESVRAHTLVRFSILAAGWHEVAEKAARGSDLTRDDLELFVRVLRAAVEVVRG